MFLQNKAKFNLAKVFSNMAKTPAEARVYCDETIDDRDPNNKIPFNHLGVTIDGLSPMDFWMNIITEASKQNLLLQLIDVVRKKNAGNETLASFYEEVKSGLEKRVEKIARAIADNKCVLFIGPELLQCLDGNKNESFSRLFAMELAAKLKNMGVYFETDSKASLSYIANRFEDMPGAVNRELGKEALESFKKASIYKNAYQKIAELQFPLVISTNPDDILEEAYKEKGIKAQTGYYDRSNDRSTQDVIEEGTCIIYKIFGSFKSPFSILFTDDDRVQFAKNVVKDAPKLPPIVRVLLENKFCLFLGFNFQEWHLKILIDCLGLVRKEERSFAISLDKINEDNMEHFERNYKFYFINEKIETFLDEVIRVKSTLPVATS